MKSDSKGPLGRGVRLFVAGHLAAVALIFAVAVTVGGSYVMPPVPSMVTDAHLRHPLGSQHAEVAKARPTDWRVESGAMASAEPVTQQAPDWAMR